MPDPIAPRGRHQVSFDWQVLPHTPDVARVWARLNVATLEEVHTNNNKGYKVLQSGGATAVYDPENIPVPMQITCAPNPINPMTRFFWFWFQV